MKATPANFKRLALELAEKEGRTIVFDEQNRQEERTRHQTVTLKHVSFLLHNFNSVIVQVNYYDGEVSVGLADRRGLHSFPKDWPPAYLRKLAEALEFGATVVEEWYLRKYGAEFAKMEEPAVSGT